MSLLADTETLSSTILHNSRVHTCFTILEVGRNDNDCSLNFRYKKVSQTRKTACLRSHCQYCQAEFKWILLFSFLLQHIFLSYHISLFSWSCSQSQPAFLISSGIYLSLNHLTVSWSLCVDLKTPTAWARKMLS